MLENEMEHGCTKNCSFFTSSIPSPKEKRLCSFLYTPETETTQVQQVVWQIYLCYVIKKYTNPFFKKITSRINNMRHRRRGIEPKSYVSQWRIELTPFYLPLTPPFPRESVHPLSICHFCQCKIF